MTEESLFTDAIAISDPIERAAFLDRACAGNDALRREVESLIAAHHASNPLDRPAVVNVNLTQSYAPSSEKPGAVIAGRYKLLEEIGAGGMGAVWVAEQLEPVKRKVALKLIKPGMDSRAVLARFEAERQALALMDHPNIAKVHDGGLTEAGRPFFVMEYVKGIPITEYCDAMRLRVEERLHLFIQVCQAVQHAHHKGVIHRDLKPSNILVAPYDGKPVPKVIDFGLAKAMHQPLTEKTLHTAHETVLGTPLYMSPEQAQLNNLDVDTRSDIYSLGVLLYELLTGTTPLDRQRFKEAAWDEIRRIIREEEPPRPSARLSSTATLPSLAASRQTEPLRLTNLLRGELDWIVMKALEKERARRYETANDFAADVAHHLAGEPVAAAPPSTAYRLRKFAHQHRRFLTTAAAFAFVLLVTTGISVWQAVRATVAEGAAEKARADAVADSKKADDARDNESKARREAVSARDDLAKSSDKLRRVLYASDMNLVSIAWNVDQPQRMINLLERHRPKNGETDLRGFEWHYWMRKLHSEARLVALEGYGPAADGSDPRELTGAPIFSPSGGRCVQAWPAAAGQGFHLRVWDTSSGRLLVQSLVTSPGTPWRKLSVMGYWFSPDESRLHIPCFEAPHGLAIDVQVVLDAHSGKWLYRLPTRELHFHGDNKRVLSVCYEEGKPWTIAWHDAATGKELSSLAPKEMEQPFFSKNLERCAAVYGGDQREVRVYETATGKVVARLPLPERTSGIPLQFSDDGKRLAIGPLQLNMALPGQTKEKPAALLMWDVDAAKHLWTRFHSIYGGGIIFAADGKRCVSFGAHSEQPVFLDTDTGREEVVFSGGNSYQLGTSRATGGKTLFSPDGALLLSWKHHGGITVHSTATGKPVFEARFPANQVRAAFAADGAALLAIDDAGRVRHWDTRDWLKKREPTDPFNVDMSFARVEPDGLTILALEAVYEMDIQKTAVKEYDARDGRLLRTVGVYPGRSFGELPAGRRAFFVEYRNDLVDRISLIDFASGRQQLLWQRGAEKFAEMPRGYLLGNDQAILQFPADENPFARNRPESFYYWGSRLRLFDLKTGAEVPSWLNAQADVEICAPSEDGKKILLLRHVGGKQSRGPRELSLVERDTGRALWTIPDLGFAATGVLFSPRASQILVTGSGPGGAIIQVYDAAHGELIYRLQSAGAMSINFVSYSPDGRRIVVPEGEPFVYRLWDAETGNELATFIPGSSHGLFRFDAMGQRLIALRTDWRSRQPGQALEVIADATPLPGEQAAANK